MINSLECDNCGIRTKRIYPYKTKFLCWNCHRRRTKILNPRDYKELTDIVASTNLTQSQTLALNEFLVENKLTKSKYLRDLIINDLIKKEVKEK